MSRITIGYNDVDVIVGYDQGGFFAQVWQGGDEERELLAVGMIPPTIKSTQGLLKKMGKWADAVSADVEALLKEHAAAYDQGTEVYVVHLDGGLEVVRS